MKTTKLLTLRWLIQREFWEHKGAFLWAPLIMGSAMTLFCLLTLGLGLLSNNVQINLVSGGLTRQAQTSPEFMIEMVRTMSNGYLWIAAPIFIMLSFIVFFYCLFGLFDERRDRSILFWKSLPVSDSLTVLSKLTMAGIVAPLISIAVAIVTSFLILLMGCSMLAIKGINVFGMVFSSPEFYLAPFELIGLIPMYLLWALPTIGWLLMVSSWARSKVFLWAVGVPVLSVVLLTWASKMFGVGVDIVWYIKHIVARLLLGVFPGGLVHVSGSMDGHGQSFSMNQAGTAMSEIFTHSWSLLGDVETWLGVVAGAIMIYVAVTMRRWREEA